MSASGLVTIAIVSGLVLMLTVIVYARLPSNWDRANWNRFKEDGHFGRGQVRAASEALRKGNFTVEDPVVRVIMLEYARYLDGSGEAILVFNIIVFACVDAALTGLYLAGPFVPAVIVVQSVLLLFLIVVIVTFTRKVRNARKFLAPWFADSVIREPRRNRRTTS